MPIPIIVTGITEGLSSVPYLFTLLKLAPWPLLLLLLKYYFGGARNGSERLMHSKVVMVTGGTSGIGASVVEELAKRGAQIILLTQHSQSDIFLVDYIEDLRESTGNQLIFAEQVDLSSLHSVRTFATKWIDNVPPRRLDMLILCANTAAPSGPKRKLTIDGMDEEWQVNYLSNFHLLSILSPALRVQPPHRDVRVIMTTCTSYIGAKLDFKQLDAYTTPTLKQPGTTKPAAKPPSKSIKQRQQPTTKPTALTTTAPRPKSLYGLSKLSLMIFAHSFQQHLNAFKRPDNQPPSTRVILVDPGFSRTPGTRRWLTGGSLWGLVVYLLTWPLWWLILKSPQQGALGILFAAMEARFGRGVGGCMIKECQEVDFARKEVTDEKVGKELWEFSEKQIEEREREGAVLRALVKREEEELAKEKEGKEEKKSTSASASALASASASASAAASTSTSRGEKGQRTGSRRSRKGK